MKRSGGGGALKTSFAKGNIEEKTSLVIDVNKAFEILGWEPKFDPETAIIRTAQSYKNIIEGKNVNKLLESEIKKYINEFTNYSLN